MKGFLLGGCGGNDRKFRMYCMKMTHVMSTRKRYTGCNDMSGKRLEYLDRHHNQCRDQANSVMTGFRLGGYGCNYERGGNQMQFENRCSGVRGVASATNHATGCNDIRNRQNEYLDRHNVACPGNKVLTYWKLNFCGGNNWKIDYTCVDVDSRPPAVPCAVSGWGAWGACSKNCGGGQQTQSRTITRNAAYGGAACPGLSQSRACNTQGCPVNCVVNEWGEWGACSKECGGGKQTKKRTVKTAAANGGQACPDLSLEQDCNEQICLLPSLAGDQCKTVEWYEELCANQFTAGDCKNAGCSYKKDTCVPAKLGKKIKCKKLKTTVGEDKESICGCFSGCKIKVKKAKKEGRADKTKCSGTHQFPKPDKD